MLQNLIIICLHLHRKLTSLERMSIEAVIRDARREGSF